MIAYSFSGTINNNADVTKGAAVTRSGPSVSIYYRAPFFASSKRYSDALQESARMESVGFLSGLVTKAAASVTNRFFTSCVWQYLFRADFLGLSPMRTVPDS